MTKLALVAALALAISVASSAPVPSRGLAAQPLPTGPSFAFTAAGDYGSSEASTATLDLIAQSGADFHLALGDLALTNADPEDDWCTHVKSQVGETFPFQLVSGSEEDDNGGEGHIDNFAECLPDQMGSVGQYPAQYYFDYQGLARFIVLSPDLIINGQYYYYADLNEYYTWAANAIDGARAAGIKWVVVAMHKNCHSMGPYYCRIFSDLENLLINKRVDLVLNGHDRTYQRSKQLATSPTCEIVPIDWFNDNCVVNEGISNIYAKGAGTVFVVVGTAGADLYAIDTADSETGYFAAWMGANINPRHGLLKVTVSEDELAAEFVGSTPTSDFSDSFWITSPN
jgi:hypothetical protein